jgi:gas vesicle protein
MRWGWRGAIPRREAHANFLSFPGRHWICGVVENLLRSGSLKAEQRRDFAMAEENKAIGVAWFLAGLGVGALVGILYAPKSGRETRDDLASGAREGTEYLRARTRQAAEEVSALVDKSKEQVNEYVERGREAVDRGRAQWEEFVERGKTLVSEQTGRVTAAVDAGRQAYKANNGPGGEAGR